MNYTNARAHKSSGADVTKNDTATYNFLTSLVEEPTPRDLRLLKNSVRENILNSRTGWVGRVPSETLHAFDVDLARRPGLEDLDKQITEEDLARAEAPAGPRRRRPGKDGKLEDVD